jgi:hypothetical protein
LVDGLIYGVECHLQQYFSYIMATSFSGGRSRREPPTMGKQLVNFITCGIVLHILSQKWNEIKIAVTCLKSNETNVRNKISIK